MCSSSCQGCAWPSWSFKTEFQPCISDHHPVKCPQHPLGGHLDMFVYCCLMLLWVYIAIYSKVMNLNQSPLEILHLDCTIKNPWFRCLNYITWISISDFFVCSSTSWKRRDGRKEVLYMWKIRISKLKSKPIINIATHTQALIKILLT